MEGSGLRLGALKKSREGRSGGQEQRLDDHYRDGEAGENKGKRQGKKEQDEDKPARPTHNNSRKRRSVLVKCSTLKTDSLSRCIRRLSTLDCIGISIYACLLLELWVCGSAAGLYTVFSASLAIPMQAPSAYGGDLGCSSAAREKTRENEHSAAEKIACTSPADTDNDEYVAGSRPGGIVLDADARSMLVGEGFHRTIITTVHIKSETADDEDERGKDAARGQKLEKTRSPSGRGETGKQTGESESELGEARERRVERGVSEKNGKGDGDQNTAEEERQANERNATGWMEGQKQDTQYGKSDAIRTHSKRTGEATGSESKGVTRSSEEEEFRKRSEEGSDSITTKNVDDEAADDSSPPVCTVTFEYTFDKIVYVDPDQTWELGLKSHSTLATHQLGDSVSGTPFSTDFLQMGSVEVFPPAVDLEAPFFATHIPSVLRVRQTLGDVSLKRLPSSSRRGGTRPATLSFGVAEDKVTDNVRQGNCFPEQPRSSFPESLHIENQRLDPHRTRDSDDGFYGTEEQVNKTNDVTEDNTQKGNRREDESRIVRETARRRRYKAVNRKEDDNVYDTLQSSGHRGGPPDASSRSGSENNRRTSSFEGFITVELPVHHRYDAACSRCNGSSVHQIRTPVVEVICCHGSGQARKKTDSQLHRRFHRKESVHAVDPARNTDKCCHRKQKPGALQDERSCVQGCHGETSPSNGLTARAPYSHSYCTSVEVAATAIHAEKTRTEGSFSKARRQVSSHDSRCYERSLPGVNTGCLGSGRRDAQANQDAPEGVAETGVQRTGALVHESKRDCQEGDENTSFLLEVPVGSAEDMPWVTVLTLTAVGTSLVATAWILGYVEAQSDFSERGV